MYGCRVMEKENGNYSKGLGLLGLTPILENQMQTKMGNDVETRVIRATV